jgi:hypothetical protein
MRVLMMLFVLFVASAMFLFPAGSLWLIAASEELVV